MQLTLIQALIFSGSFLILGLFIGFLINRYKLKDWISKKTKLVQSKWNDVLYELSSVPDPTDEQIQSWHEDILICQTKINFLLILYKEFIRHEDGE